MVYDPLVSGEINHDALPLLMVLFLGEYNPKILKVTFPVASSLTTAYIRIFSPSTISEVMMVMLDCALLIFTWMLFANP